MTRRHYTETRSLMDDMLLPENIGLDADCVVLTADFQTAGRGQHDHKWESARGKNLTLGVIIHPTSYAANEQKRMSDDIAEAVRLTVNHFLDEIGTKAWMKQPNDIYVGDKKIAGMLIEHDLRGKQIITTRIGLGLNINQTIFESDAPNPISLSILLNHDLDIEDVLNTFLSNLQRLVH